MNIPALSTLLTCIATTLFFIACQPAADQQGQQTATASGKKEKAVPIIFDTDIGPDYDDTGALAMLHALADRGEADVLATVASNKHALVAPVIDMINTYYGRPDLPIGAPKGSGGVSMTSGFQWPAAVVDQYPHNVQSTGEVPDAVTVYRQLLSQQPDTSVTIVTVGFMTNMAHLLQSGPDSLSNLGGSDLVKQKVKHLVSMAGGFPEGKEFNIEMDSTASRYVAEHWPTPITFSGFEIGEKVLTGARLVQQASQDNPVRHIYAYALGKEQADNRMSWDQTAVLIAVRGADDYFDLRRGQIQVNADGSNTWQDDAQGRHYYVVEKMPIPALRDTIETLMMHEPK